MERRRSLIVVFLIAATLLFTGLAIFLAWSINNRNVNPTDTNAASSCEGVYDNCMDSCVNQGKANCGNTTCNSENIQVKEIKSDIERLKNEKSSCDDITITEQKTICENDINNRINSAERDLKQAESSLNSCLNDCYSQRSNSCETQCEQESLNCKSASNGDTTGSSGSSNSAGGNGGISTTPIVTTTNLSITPTDIVGAIPDTISCDKISYNQCPARCTSISCSSGDKKCASSGTSESSICPQSCGGKFCGSGQYCSSNNNTNICCNNSDPNCNAQVAPSQSGSSGGGSSVGGNNSGGSSSGGGTSSVTTQPTPVPATCKSITINKATLSSGQYAVVTMVVNNVNTNSGDLVVFNKLNNTCNGTSCAANIPPVDADRNSAGQPLNSGLVYVNGSTSSVRFVTPSSTSTFTWSISYKQLFGTTSAPVKDKTTNKDLTSVQLNGIAGGMTNFDPKCVTFLTKATSPSVTTTIQGSTIPTIINSISPTSTSQSSTITTIPITTIGGSGNLPNTGVVDYWPAIAGGIIIVVSIVIASFYRRRLEDIVAD